MEIEISYSNGANIPSGNQYEGLKPFYHGKIKLDAPAKVNRHKLIEEELKKLKALIDPLVMDDFKNLKGFRNKCICKPLYDQEKHEYIHDNDCPKGWK